MGGRTHQGVDISGPKRSKGRLSGGITGELSFRSFGYRTLIQGRESEHVQPFTLSLFRNVVCIRLWREVLLNLPKAIQPQSIHETREVADEEQRYDLYARDLDLRDQRER